MKRMIIIAVLGLLAMVPSWGQTKEKLQTDSVFVKKYLDTGIYEVSGNSLSKYKLNTFKSIKFRASEKDLEQIEAWIRHDARQAQDSNLETDGGKLVYALLCFEEDNSRKKSYIGYQCRESSEGIIYVTVVRMTGKATTKELKLFFKQK